MIYEDISAAHLREWGRDSAHLSDAELESAAEQMVGWGVRAMDGRLVGLGGVKWMDTADGARCFAFFDARERSIWVHRKARHLYAALAAAGEREVWAILDQTIPNAERWLRRLGFQPHENGAWRLGLGSVDSSGAADWRDAPRRGGRSL